MAHSVEDYYSFYFNSIALLFAYPVDVWRIGAVFYCYKDVWIPKEKNTKNNIKTGLVFK